MIEEPLGLGIHGQPRPERGVDRFQVDPVAGQVVAERIEPLAQERVVRHALADLAGRQPPPEPVGDHSRVAQGAGEVPFEDVGSEHGRVARADRLQPAAEVELVALGPAAAELRMRGVEAAYGLAGRVDRHDRLAPFHHRQAASFARHQHPHAPTAAETVQRVHVLAPRPALGAELLRPRQAADLEDQRRAVIGVIDDLRVGGLAVVVVAQAPANAHHARRQRRIAQEPAGDVHLVDSLVAQVAVAVVVDPVPVVVEVLPGQGLQRRRAGPEVVIQSGRDLSFAHLADRHARLVAGATRVLDLSQVARPDPGHGLDHVGVGAGLRSGLDHASVLACGADELSSLEDIVGDRLLQIDVLSGLAGPDGGQRVPVVGRSDGHGVDILAGDQLAHVLEGAHRRPVAACLLGQPAEHGRIDVAQGRQAETGDAGGHGHVQLAAAPHADHPHPDRIIGPQHPARCPGSAEGERGAERGSGQKAAAMECRHLRSLTLPGVRG